MGQGVGSAIILGADTPIGLTLIRELGLNGVEIYAIGSRPDAIGLRSRYVKQGYVRSDSKAEWAALIRAIGQKTGARHILAVSESDIAFLNAHFRDDPLMLPLVPRAEEMAIVLDKARCYQLAAEIGNETPTVWGLNGQGDLKAQLGQVQLPVVLKWPNPHVAVDLLRAHGLPCHKFEYFYDLTALECTLRKYRSAGVMPLVQSYCPGYGVGQMVFLHKGEPLLVFQHRRLHEWPPEGGSSTLCESLPPQEHREQMALSVALLRKIGWEGAAMVEYRYDPARTRLVLMEINGRFWGSQPLAFHAGAHFGWLTYAALGHGIVPEFASPQAGVRCRYLIPDIKRLLRILLQPGRIQDHSLRFDRMAEIRNVCRYYFGNEETSYVWWRRDPGPFFADMGHAMLRLMGLRRSA